MKKMISALVVAAMTACAMSAGAISVGPTTTYSGLTWTFSSNAVALAGCNQLLVDGSGDLTRGIALALSGALNCGVGGYGVSGAGYFSSNGQFNMTVQIGVGVVMTCFVPSATFSGTCTIWSSGTSGSIGTANIIFVR